ncbi:helix-turn-helix transcriptional regulator [Nonomuraea sp. NPDC003754]
MSQPITTSRTSPSRGTPLATEREVATYLSKPPGTLRNWRYRGKGPRWLRLEGGGVRYRWSDVETWLDAQMPNHGGAA